MLRWLLRSQITAKKNTATTYVLSENFNVFVLEFAPSDALVDPFCAVVEQLLLLVAWKSVLIVLVLKLNIGFECNREINVGRRLLIFHFTLSLELICIHEVYFIVQHTVVRKADWTNDTKVEVCFARVGKQRDQWYLHAA